LHYFRGYIHWYWCFPYLIWDLGIEKRLAKTRGPLHKPVFGIAMWIDGEMF